MLLHIRPRLFSRFKHVSLIDLAITPLGLHLRGDDDLATRRPYRNKYYAVACRKQGHKAIDGILIETAAPVDEMRYTARWAVEASAILTHHVHYKLLDHDFDAASDDMTLWYASSPTLGGRSKRWPAWANDVPPVLAEPIMEALPAHTGPRVTSEDVLDERGLIVCRRQTFPMPTIERARILSSQFNERIPQLGAAFVEPFT
jgi:hypothetical protein